MAKQHLHNKKIRLFLATSILILTSCTFITRVIQPTTPPATQIPANTIPAEPSIPPETSQTPAKLPATDALPAVPIVYYYFVAVESNTYPAGSVVVVPDLLILGPTLSEIGRTSDPVTNIRSALQAMLNDPRNAWVSTDVGITSINFQDGTANVVLEGEYFGVGDAVLIAARAQILLTVFAEASVQAATITLNGGNIANLGVSHSSQAKPDDYTYARDEVEAFMAENAYPRIEP